MVDKEASLKARMEWAMTHNAEFIEGKGDFGPPGFSVGIYCNGCKRFVGDASVTALLKRLEGWELGENPGDDDFCPNCKGE